MSNEQLKKDLTNAKARFKAASKKLEKLEASHWSQLKKIRKKSRGLKK